MITVASVDVGVHLNDGVPFEHDLFTESHVFVSVRHGGPGGRVVLFVTDPADLDRLTAALAEARADLVAGLDKVAA